MSTTSTSSSSASPVSPRHSAGALRDTPPPAGLEKASASAGGLAARTGGSESGDSDEFFDANESLVASGGGSLKRRLVQGAGCPPAPPLITISSASNRDSSNDVSLSSTTFAQPPPPTSTSSSHKGSSSRRRSSSNQASYVGGRHHAASTPSVPLPEDIARELEALTGSLEDPRKNRIDRLEQIRRGTGTGIGTDNSSVADSVGGGSEYNRGGEGEEGVKYHDSAESSVEGIYVNPSRPSHPFKVIEPEDRRSVSSDTTRSIQSRSTTGRYSADPATFVMMPPPPPQQLPHMYTDSHTEFPHSGSGGRLEGAGGPNAPQHIPDVVSSSQSDVLYSPQLTTHQQSSQLTHQPPPPMGAAGAMGPPHRPPRRKKRDNYPPEGEQHSRHHHHHHPTQNTLFSSLNIFKRDSVGSANLAATLPDHLGNPTTTTTTAEPNIPNLKQRREQLSLQMPEGASAALGLVSGALPSPAVVQQQLSPRGGGAAGQQLSLGRQTSVSRLTSQQGGAGCDPLPSPQTAIDSLTRDLESKLDLQAALSGQFVVKPQDDIRTRGDSRPFVPPDHLNLSPMEEDEDEEERQLEMRSPPSSIGGGGKIGSGGGKSFGFDNSLGSRSFKSASAGSGSGGTRHSSMSAPAGGGGGGGPAGSHSLGSSKSTNTNAGMVGSAAGTTSSSGSGGKRSLAHSGGVGGTGSMDSAVAGAVKRQLNMLVRTKTDSGKVLSDEDILKQIKVKNLDTGEEMDLVKAEDQLPESINPLSLHIMRLTSEYCVSGEASKSQDSDADSRLSSVSGFDIGGGKKKASGVRRLLKTTFQKTTGALGMVADVAKKKGPGIGKEPHQAVVAKDKMDVEKLGRLATEIKPSEGAPGPSRDGKGLIFKRIQAHKSGPFDFEDIQFAQEVSSPHFGPIWCMRFSQCGQLLATAGKDTILQIWVLKSAYHYFKDMRSRYTADAGNTSPTNSYENVISDQMESEDKSYQVFMDTPFASYKGHTSDLLDVSWSKNYFILTSSMDKTVRLWHISRKECLCCFQHIDFVTAISFHPRNDQFFLSGSLDGKLRLWNIPEKKVACWNEVDGSTNLITAANFIQNGKFAVVGTYDGRCIFYNTDQLKYYTMIHVRSTRGKNKQGRKVTGIEPMPGEDKILITSCDSRIRLYDLRDLSLSCKYKGYSNNSSQIRAMFSHDGKYITAGSENQCVYLWRTNNESNNLTVRKDKNSYWEAIKAHNAAVTCSVFAPNPSLILEQLRQQQQQKEDNLTQVQQTLELDAVSAFSSAPSSPPPPSSVSGGAATATGSALDRSKSVMSASGTRDRLGSNVGSPGGGALGPSPPAHQTGYVVISGDYDGAMNVFVNISKPRHASLPSPSSKPFQAIA